MLEHEQPEAVTLPAAAEKRVTSEEFAKAVSAIEARKADQAKTLAGTLPIGEGIHELGLDASPEEVWAEVEAQRARAASQRVAPPQFSYQTKPVTPVVVPRQNPRWGRRWIALGIFFFIFGVSRHAFFPSIHIAHPSQQARAESLGQIRTLAEIPNGRTVYCSTTLQEITRGTPLTKVRVHDEQITNDWPLIKHDNRVYLRGFTLPSSAEAIENTGTHLYNDDNAGELHGVSDSPLTVPVSQILLGNISSNGQWTEILTPPIHLDAHAFEDWSDDD